LSTVRVPPVLRAEVGGAREVEASGATLRELLDDLTERMPALGSRVYDEGELQPFVNVYVDGEDVRTRDGLETPVGDQSTVILLPAMAGGSLASPTGARSRRAKPASAAACRA
jgi:molybdopterin converting factor small subunit